MRSARQNTLTRMRMLIAASTTTAALSVNCNDCGYTTVDPLPGPGPFGGTGGFCGGVATTFKVGARSYATPPADGEITDASIDASPPPIADASADAGDAGREAGSGGGRRDAGASTSKDRTTFFAIEVRSGTVGGGGSVAGISLKRAVFTLQSGKILNIRQSELLTEMDIDSTGLDRVTITVLLDASCGGSNTATVRFDIRFDSNGEVSEINGSDSLGGSGSEPLANEL